MSAKVLVLLCFSIFSLASGQAQHRVLLTFGNEIELQEGLAAFAKTASLHRNHPYKIQRLRASAARHIALIESASEPSALLELPGVVSATADRKLTSRRTPDDPYFGEQWNMRKIDAPGAWEYTTGGLTAAGTEIVIAVIEVDGFQLDHPELQNQYYLNPHEIAGNGIDDDGNGYADDITGWNFLDGGSQFIRDSHGVHVCATLGAETDNQREAAGVNWDPSILPLYIGTSINNWILALDYITFLRERYNASAGDEGAFIVAANMSFGTRADCQSSDYIDINQAIERAGEVGILSVGAADNDIGRIGPLNPDLPATCESDFVIAVTASTEEDDIFGGSAYSTVHVDLSAPGSPYQSVDYQGRRATFVGCSGATPHVTGTVGLLYAVPCPNLQNLISTDPALASLLVKEAVLNSVDPASDLLDKVLSRGRLNARKAIEYLLTNYCTSNALVVQLEEGIEANSSLALVNGELLQFERTLSDQWNIHLYKSNGADIQEALENAKATAGIRAVEADVRFLLRSRTPNDPAFQHQTALQRISMPSAWGTVYGTDATISTNGLEVVTAVFDRNFSLEDENLTGRVFVNSAEIADNGLDDDNNGIPDDVNGINLINRSGAFSTGTHGTAMANLLAGNAEDRISTVGIDWTGKYLPVEGNSLAHWIEGAAYIYSLRQNYNRGLSESAALITSYLTPQGGSRSLPVNASSEVVEHVISALFSEGILTIGAAEQGSMYTETDFPGAVNADGVIIVAESAQDEPQKFLRFPTDIRANIAFAPGNEVMYSLVGLDTFRISGSSASAALVAGSVGLLYQLECLSSNDAPRSAPRATAAKLKQAIIALQNQRGNEASPQLNVGAVAAVLNAECVAEESCALISVLQNPIQRQSSAQIIAVGTNGTSCPVSVYDALGRLVYVQDAAPNTSVNVVELPIDRWQAGMYYLSLGDNSLTTKPLVLVN